MESEEKENGLFKLTEEETEEHLQTLNKSLNDKLSIRFGCLFKLNFYPDGSANTCSGSRHYHQETSSEEDKYSQKQSATGCGFRITEMVYGFECMHV